MSCGPARDLSSWIHHVRLWRMHSLPLLDAVFYKYQWHQRGQQWCSDILWLSWMFFCPVVLSISGRGVLYVKYCNCGIIYFFLSFCQCSLHVFWDSIVDMHTYNCCVFLINCSFYHYEISHLFLVTFLSWSLFYVIFKMMISFFLCTQFAWHVFFPSIYF